jgi:DNA-binding CsgD family transcriptional regulator
MLATASIFVSRLCAFRECIKVSVDRDMAQTKLTLREIQVLRLVAKGLTNREISEILGVSIGTVNTHVHRILRKLGVSNRTRAVAWAFRNGHDSR